MKGSSKTAAVAMAFVIAVLALVIPIYRDMHHPEPIKKGPGVTAIKMLSDYFPGLKGSAGDTEVYILDSGKPGGTVMVLGGTHPNEPSGYISAILLLENAQPTAGRLIILPRANASAFTHTDYMEGSPQKITVQDGGRRTLVSLWFAGDQSHQPVA